MYEVFTDNEMASLRTEAQKWYSDTVDIYRNTLTSDVYGGQADSWAQIAEGVPCDILAQSQTARPMEVVGEQVEVRQTFSISLPVGTDIQVHDKVVVTSQAPNQELIIQAVDVPSSDQIDLMVVGSREGEPV